MTIARRRMMMTQIPSFDPDPDIPAAWKAVETVHDPWSEIIYHAQIVGDYKTRYILGDTKVADFGDQGLVLMRLVGFDCDEMTAGGYAKMSWVPEHCLKTVWKWDLTNHNVNGYNSSRLKYRIDSLLTKLPKSLQDGIVEVKKSCRRYGSTDQFVNVKLWAPSCREYYGTDTSYAEKSGPVYTNPPQPAKKTGDSPDGDAVYSWSRSASYNATSTAVVIFSNNAFLTSGCSNANGVIVGFSI